MKNYVKTVLCVPVFLWIMGASVLGKCPKPLSCRIAKKYNYF